MRKIWIVIALIFSQALHASWSSEVKEDATVGILYEGSTIVQSKYTFWGPDWGWAQTKIEAGKWTDKTLPFKGNVKRLYISIDGKATAGKAGELRLGYRFEAKQATPAATGGCLEFELRKEAFPNAGEPALLPDNMGWEWTIERGHKITVRSDKPLAKVNFEGGSTNLIRIWFYHDGIAAGEQKISLTVTLPAGGDLSLTPSQRFGHADDTGWRRDYLLPTDSPVDLRFLNHMPAGSKGGIKAIRDQLYFSDGTPARFWGTNVAAYSLFVDKSLIKKHAQRIAKLGFNLVRLHHHDSNTWVKPTVIARDESNTQNMDEEALDRLFYWVKCLQDEGVYVWVDLLVGRHLKEGDVDAPGGKVPGFDEIMKRKGDIKGFSFYNPGIQSLMAEFNEKYLSTLNPYTGVALKDDPSVVAFLITNENDLVKHFQYLMDKPDEYPVHHQLFLQAAEAFSKKSGLPMSQLENPWIKLGRLVPINQEYVFFAKMIEQVRSLPTGALMVGGDLWGDETVASIPSLTAGQLLDFHTYASRLQLQEDPHYVAGMIDWPSAYSLPTLPTTVSEWGVELDDVTRGVLPLPVAAMATFQGWSAMMHYNYSQGTFWSRAPASTWSSYADPLTTGIMPACAILYRMNHLTPPRHSYFLKLSREDILTNKVSPKSSMAMRTLPEQSRVRCGLPAIEELPWLQETPAPEGSTLVTDLDKDFLPEGQTFVESDTGEVRRDWDQILYTINSPKTQAAEGLLEGKTIELDNLTVKLDMPLAVAVVSSLDDEPIGRSHKMLLTTIGRAFPTEGRLPYRVEPTRGKLTLKAVPGLAVYPLSPAGKKKEPLEAPYSDGAYHITFDGENNGSLWFLIEPASE